jgi:hypothetical protein
MTTAAFVAVGCKKKEEEPPPMPSAPAPTATAPAPAPTPVAIAPEEDAGVVVVDAGVDVKPVSRPHPADVAGLRACCTALQQNAASMPAPQNAYAGQAAAICLSMVNSMATGSTTKAGALGAIGAMLKGVSLPPACH